ncbi:MAG: bifunctional lysylphosphatidylglycerol flippase/synthetase MprF [Gemmatimonadaceae bacterium]|nr:bifunctional lysylphosphatidylglycerol flippase/synthetase MprF [Gemmatimonadaceae bacterium]
MSAVTLPNAEPPAGPAGVPRWWRGARPWLTPVFGLAALAVMLLLLARELSHVRYHEIVAAARAVPWQALLLSVAATIASYAVLPGYDAIALRWVGRRLRYRQIAFASIITYGVSQTLGFAAFTGSSLRLRLWSAWGLDTWEIARAAAFSGATFTLGILTLTGLVGVVEPLVALQRLHLPVMAVRLLSALCLCGSSAWVAISVARVRSLRLGGHELRVPAPSLVARQYAVAAADWCLAALSLWVLLPAGHGVGALAFFGAFLLSQGIGLLSHVPGGIGVFETLMVLQFGDTVRADRLLGAILAWRAVYYLLPFTGAIALLVTHEARWQRARLARAASMVSAGFERWAEPLLPTAIGAMTMIGGAMLLLSGATPSLHGRMRMLVDVMPLGVVELSHFAASVAGTGLVVLGWALTRRLDAAAQLTRVLLGVGIAASLLKGLDYEEATALSVVFVVLTASRRAFYRRASLLAEPLSPGWVAAVLAVVGVSVWTGLFAFRHVEYSTDLWWHFAERADAPRFLRASAGAAIALGVVGAVRLLRHAAPVLALPTTSELEEVAALVPRLPETAAALALLGDKHLMFAEQRDGFLMYGVSGGSWVALGDPMGSDHSRRELAWRFREAADQHGAAPVFYEVSNRHLPLYIDLGLTLFKLGEEGRVPLESFAVDGGGRRGLRRTIRDVERAGGAFELIESTQVPTGLPELERVSNAWLGAKATREKGFSLGRWDPTYIERFPCAVIRIDRRIVAFANVWTGNGSELSVDLMRHLPDAPPGAMEYLFIQLMLLGRARGFRWMNLGMAPLSGMEAHALAPRWHRVARLLYSHAEHFYNFRGLRAWKEKFDPEWEPRYLASPAGLALPRVLANVASLISGGIAGLVLR